MIVYLDSTFVIRQLLGVGKAPAFWGKWEKAYASTLMRTECFRAANLLRLNGKIDDAGRARIGSWIDPVCSTPTQVPVSESIVRRAADAFPVAVGTIQAIHLATLQELEATHGVKCELASADDGLGLAAKARGFTEATDKPEASADAAKTAAKEK